MIHLNITNTLRSCNSTFKARTLCAVKGLYKQ